MGITEEMIAYNGSEAYYKVKVKSFKQKMLTWSKSKVLSLNKQTFQLFDPFPTLELENVVFSSFILS